MLAALSGCMFFERGPTVYIGLKLGLGWRETVTAVNLAGNEIGLDCRNLLLKGVDLGRQ